MDNNGPVYLCFCVLIIGCTLLVSSDFVMLCTIFALTIIHLVRAIEYACNHTELCHPRDVSAVQ